MQNELSVGAAMAQPTLVVDGVGLKPSMQAHQSKSCQGEGTDGSAKNVSTGSSHLPRGTRRKALPRGGGGVGARNKVSFRRKLRGAAPRTLAVPYDEYQGTQEELARNIFENSDYEYKMWQREMKIYFIKRAEMNVTLKGGPVPIGQRPKCPTPPAPLTKRLARWKYKLRALPVTGVDHVSPVENPCGNPGKVDIKVASSSSNNSSSSSNSSMLSRGRGPESEKTTAQMRRERRKKKQYREEALRRAELVPAEPAERLAEINPAPTQGQRSPSGETKVKQPAPSPPSERSQSPCSVTSQVKPNPGPEDVPDSSMPMALSIEQQQQFRDDFENWLYARSQLQKRNGTFAKQLAGWIRQYLKLKKLDAPPKALVDAMAGYATSRMKPSDVEVGLADAVEDPKVRFQTERLNGALDGALHIYNERNMRDYTKERMNDSFLGWQRVVDVFTGSYSRKYGGEYISGHVDKGFKRCKQSMKLNPGNELSQSTRV